MASVLHKFVSNTKILPSQVNENFKFLQEDIAILTDSADSKLSSTKESILGDIEIIKSSLEESLQGLEDLPHIIEMSEESLLPSWYKKYSNGFLEIGGIAPAIATGKSTTVTLPYTMKEGYSVLTSGEGKVNNDDPLWIRDITNNSFTIYHSNMGNDGEGVKSVKPHWIVSGYISIESEV